jgi:hypothetical protein
MRVAVVGAVVLAGLVVAMLGTTLMPREGFAQRLGPTPTSTSGLITHTTPLGDNRQQLTVIDPEMRVMSVYHIETSTGQIVLKSVRNFHWDLQMLEFNGTNPLPREIRAMLEQK